MLPRSTPDRVMDCLNYDFFAAFSSYWMKYRLEYSIKSIKPTDCQSDGQSNPAETIQDFIKIGFTLYF